MLETLRREADFLHQGLPKILLRELKENKCLLTKVAFAVLFERSRDFAADLEKLTLPLEQPEFFGTENIQAQDISPLIVVCNHPSGDTLIGAAFISVKLAKTRKEFGLPLNIRWLIGANIPNHQLPLKETVVFKTTDFLRGKFIKTYDFIPVPINENGSWDLSVKRMKSFRTALRYLDGETIAPTIGITPEGGRLMENGPGFSDGASQLVRCTKNKDLKVLPVGIFRSEAGRICIRFGQIIPAEVIRGMKCEEASEKIKEAILNLIPKEQERSRDF